MFIKETSLCHNKTENNRISPVSFTVALLASFKRLYLILSFKKIEKNRIPKESPTRQN
jgi:hypothetical protein